MERDAVPDVDTSIMQAPPGEENGNGSGIDSLPLSEAFTGLGD